MQLERSTQQLRVTFVELAFRNESMAMVLEQAAHEMPMGYSAKVADVIALLKKDAETMRELARRTQDGLIVGLE